MILRNWLPICVLIAVAGCNRSASPSDPAKRREQATALIERVGGRFEDDHSAPGFPIVSADLSRSESVTDADLTDLAVLSDLQTLRLNHTTITGAGLAHLAGLTKLRKLDLTKTKVGDDGLI